MNKNKLLYRAYPDNRLTEKQSKRLGSEVYDGFKADENKCFFDQSLSNQLALGYLLVVAAVLFSLIIAACQDGRMSPSHASEVVEVR